MPVLARVRPLLPGCVWHPSQRNAATRINLEWRFSQCSLVGVQDLSLASYLLKATPYAAATDAYDTSTDPASAGYLSWWGPKALALVG